VNSAREAARKAQCANNVKQLALGMINFEAQFGRFPSGGWGWRWVGDPDRGFDPRSQPGAWCFQTLPYIDQRSLFEMAAGQPAATKSATIAQMIQIPLAVHNCPSRRTLQVFPFTEQSSLPLYGTNPATSLAHTDYAANCGDPVQNYDTDGPSTLATGDQWTAANSWSPPNTTFDIVHYFTGISYMRSKVSLANVTDGASNTYLIGEKYLTPDNYYNGVDPADDQALLGGFDNDNYRSTLTPPMQDTPGVGNTVAYGSAHPGSYNATFCDGSVHAISYFIDPLTHLHLGNRADGAAIDFSKIGN
jgi:prepilin-type processing-associated H-X9-DG protein